MHTDTFLHPSRSLPPSVSPSLSLSPSLCLTLSLSLCSEKPLSLQILLTERQEDQSSDSLEQQPRPLSPCLVKPLPPSSVPSDSIIGVAASSSREESRTKGPCSHFGKPLTSTGSLPALCVDPLEQSSLEDLAPPPAPEDADLPAKWTRTPPVSIPTREAPQLRQYSQTPSPVDSNDRCHLMMKEEEESYRHPQTTTPHIARLALPPSTNTTRNWSCLSPDHPDAVDSPVDPPLSSPPYSPPESLSSAPPPTVSWPGLAPSLPPSHDYRAALPVERWAENVNRYYGSQNATVGGEAMPDEELSELDSLYQASLLAPSMPRGSRGVSPQPTNNKPGKNFIQRVLLSDRSLRTEIKDQIIFLSLPVLSSLPSCEDENYSAENLRRITRSLSGTVIGSRPQNLGPSRSSSCFLIVWLPLIELRENSVQGSSELCLNSFSQSFFSSSSSSSSSSGPGSGVQQQFLAVSDRHQALSGQSLHSVAMSYGTLPRAPRRALPPSSTSSLPRPRASSGPPPPTGPQSLYATLSHPRRSANTNGHYRQPSLPNPVNGSSCYAPHPHRVHGEGPPQPLRLDMPPETDWRREADYRTVQPSSSWDPRTARHHQPLHRTSSHQPPTTRPLRDPHFCSLCQQLPAEPSRPYCKSCGAYVSRFRPAS
uniref:Uncharacterized protein n=1 Tax=Labrus bergylta TaxID=56723 RepID=A0A3Q3DZ78_9LABR